MRNFFIVIFIFNIFNGFAQHVMYTNVNPDRTISLGDSFLLDLNNDGFNDFDIFQYTQVTPTAYSMVGIRPKRYNQVVGDTDSIYFYPKALASGANINGTLNRWKSDIGFGMSMNYQIGTTGYGNWQGDAKDKYLGLRIFFYSNYYYGWARLDVAADGKSFTIKDYAYDTVAYEPLNAGQGLPNYINEDISPDKISVFVTGQTLIIDSRANVLKNDLVCIYNILGKELYSGVISSSYFPVELSSFNKGVYIVKISSNKELLSRKFIYRE